MTDSTHTTNYAPLHAMPPQPTLKPDALFSADDVHKLLTSYGRQCCLVGDNLTLDFATNLATNMARKFYPEVTDWTPLPDLFGVLTQISNMTTGLSRDNK